jgi:hypothetical protein
MEYRKGKKIVAPFIDKVTTDMLGSRTRVLSSYSLINIFFIINYRMEKKKNKRRGIQSISASLIE